MYPAVFSHSRSERKRVQSEQQCESRVQKEKEHSTCVKCSFSFCEPTATRVEHLRVGLVETHSVLEFGVVAGFGARNCRSVRSLIRSSSLRLSIYLLFSKRLLSSVRCLLFPLVIQLGQSRFKCFGLDKFKRLFWSSIFKKPCSIT